MQKIITSSQNCLVKEVIRLKQEKHRKKAGIILIEGEKEVGMAKNANLKLERAVVCLDYDFDKSIISGISEGKVYKVSKDIFEKLSRRENPDGVLVFASAEQNLIEELELKNDLLILAIENLEKPGNLGAILRSADAVGADAVILVDTKLDKYNPNVIRTSRGSVFSVPVFYLSLADFSKWSKNNSIEIFAATPDSSDYYTNFDYQGRISLLLGNEHEGLSVEALSCVEKKIKIPMLGKIDSLNVSVSSAVLLYEVLRQKRLKKL